MATREQESRGCPGIPSILFTALVAVIPGALPVWADQPVPTLSINDVTLDESSCEGKNFVFTVTLSRLANKPVSVNYATSDGSAVADKDYLPVSGTLTFNHDMPPNGPRGTYLRAITVPLGNYVVASSRNDGRTFTVTLSGATNATIIESQGTGTLTNAATSCTPAQNGVCYVNFCGAHTSCKNVNISATATPYCQLALAGGECVGTVFKDSDGDGFSDAAEAQGYIDVNANGVYDPGIDIPLPGADPNKPDVYLHYDYTWASDHNHNPPAQAIQWIVDAFAAHGINLHIDPQHNAICENAGDPGCITAGTGAQVVTLTVNPDASCVGTSAVSIAQMRAAVPYLSLIKPAYHYMIFGHYVGCPGDNPGLCAACPADPTNPACGSLASQKPSGENLGMAEVIGDDSIVATQPYVDGGVPISSMPLEAWSGLAMHEFGHNLGLLHGGADCFNFKPNYVSVMSYSFYRLGIQVGASPGDVVPQACTTDADCNAGDHAVPAHCSTTTNTCFRIDYSDRVFNSLDETGGAGGLDETIGLQGGANNTDISWRRAHDGHQLYVRIPTNGAPIDWNDDGSFEVTAGKSVEVNDGDGFEVDNSQNDWATIVIGIIAQFRNLTFSYQCNPNFGDP